MTDNKIQKIVREYGTHGISLIIDAHAEMLGPTNGRLLKEISQELREALVEVRETMEK